MTLELLIYWHSSKKRKLNQKQIVPDYGIQIDDEVDTMSLDELFDKGVVPQSEKKFCTLIHHCIMNLNIVWIQTLK